MAKRLLTQAEEATNDILKPLCEKWGAHAFVKVRLADILPIENSGIDDSDFRFALQSHFDFVVADTDIRPLFAVEFDGRTHASDVQQQRDRRKNQLCERFGLPLLRINSRYLVSKYRQMDVLSWFVNYWFASRMIDDAYEQGQIPPDEYVDPAMFLSLPGSNEEFPLWLTADVLCRIRELHEHGRCLDASPSSFVGSDESGNCRAISYLRITETSAVYALTGMRGQQFPVPASEVLEAIALNDLYEQLSDVIERHQQARPIEELAKYLDSFRDQYALLSSSTYGEPPTLRWNAI
ncbi:MAG: DUF2726 domain-containing protein [Pirellulales bacterium]|nr:DUF2726 domain-containing protein [Pirellulales bacterium]